MRLWQRWMYSAGLVAAGYVLGASGALELRMTGAQEQPAETGLAKETLQKLRTANNSLRDAADALKSEGRYEALTEEVNSFLVLSGGGNAKQDLESGAGVDPETFAALYAGAAVPEIADQIEFDDEKRLTYNGQVVRMYSKARLQRMQAERVKLANLRPE